MNEDQAKGKAKQLEGQGQESWGDAKEKADETWEEAKDKLDDLGDNFGDIKDKLRRTSSATTTRVMRCSRRPIASENRESVGPRSR